MFSRYLGILQTTANKTIKYFGKFWLFCSFHSTQTLFILQWCCSFFVVVDFSFFFSASHSDARILFFVCVSVLSFSVPRMILSPTQFTFWVKRHIETRIMRIILSLNEKKKTNIPIEVVQILCTRNKNRRERKKNSTERQSNKHNIRTHFVSHSFQHHKKNKSSRLLFAFKFNVGFHYFYILCIIINDTYQWGDKE